MPGQRKDPSKKPSQEQKHPKSSATRMQPKPEEHQDTLAPTGMEQEPTR